MCVCVCVCVCVSVHGGLAGAAKRAGGGSGRCPIVPPRPCFSNLAKICKFPIWERFCLPGTLSLSKFWPNSENKGVQPKGEGVWQVLIEGFFSVHSLLVQWITAREHINMHQVPSEFYGLTMFSVCCGTRQKEAEAHKK